MKCSEQESEKERESEETAVELCLYLKKSLMEQLRWRSLIPIESRRHSQKFHFNLFYLSKELSLEWNLFKWKSNQCLILIINQKKKV